MSGFVEVDGIAWCPVHHGVIDECADHVDDNGEPCCDMRDNEDGTCVIVVLYTKASAS